MGKEIDFKLEFEEHVKAKKTTKAKRAAEVKDYSKTINLIKKGYKKAITALENASK